jgi:hypothetical protein
MGRTSGQSIKPSLLSIICKFSTCQRRLSTGPQSSSSFQNFAGKPLRHEFGNDEELYLRTASSLSWHSKRISTAHIISVGRMCSLTSVQSSNNATSKRFSAMLA